MRSGLAMGEIYSADCWIARPDPGILDPGILQDLTPAFWGLQDLTPAFTHDPCIHTRRQPYGDLL